MGALPIFGQIALLLLQWAFAHWQKKQAEKMKEETLADEHTKTKIAVLDAIAKRDSGRLGRMASGRADRLRVVLDGLPESAESTAGGESVLSGGNSVPDKP